MELGLIAFGFVLGACAMLGAGLIIGFLVGWVFPTKDGPG